MLKIKRGVCDTRCQQFQKEAVKKEEKLKSLWFLKNRQQLYDNLEKDKFSKQTKSFLQKKKIERESGTKHEESFKMSNVKSKILPPWRPSTKDVPFDLMKPVDPFVKNILYAPKDASFMSQKKYLQERYKEKPEDRYYYPYCSSWIWGWRLKDYRPSVASQYGVRSIIQSTFYRRNASSVKRDPDWYRICQIDDPNNYSDFLTY